MKKSTWIIIGLVAVLSVIYFVTKEDQVSVGIKRITLPSFSADTIDRIEIVAKEPINLKNEGGTWLINIGDKDKPRFVKADAAAVKSALEAAAEIKHAHYVTSLKEKYAELGVEGADAVMVKLYNKDAVVWALVLGKNANNAGRYAKIPEENDVHVVRGSFFRLTKGAPSDWRNREIVPIKDTEAKSVTITKDSVPFIVLAKDGDQWNFDKTQVLPEGFRVDKNALAGLVRLGTNLRAQGFVDKDEVLANKSLALTVTSEKETVTVEFFPGTSDKYYVKRSGDDQIYEVNKNMFDRLNKALDEYRDLSLLSFDKAAITKLTIGQGKDQVVVSKKDNEWKVTAPTTLPKDFEFDQTTAEDMITMLAGLSAERVARPGKDVAQNASWLKAWMVELETNTGDKVLLFASKNKGGSDEHVVKGNIDKDVYVIKSARLSSLNGGLNAFKKEAYELPPVDENTKGFDSLPPDVRQKLLDAMKNRK